MADGTQKISKAATDARAASAPVQRLARARSRGNGAVADWAGVDGVVLSRAVASVAARGCAIRLGYTRDAGAFAIGIIGDGEPYTLYVRPTEDVDQYLRDLEEDFAK